MTANGELSFLPLGGVGEIGMNLGLYGYGGRWLMVDLGISFADERLPGIDVIMPDISFIAERSEALEGLVLTHAHEDHLGAVAHLWPRLRCPVYATPFTAAVLRTKLHETGVADQITIHEVPLGGRLPIGCFDVEFISVTHSIPEPNILAIRTPAGLVVHTGDWKLDPEPLVGPVADEAGLRRLGEEGVLALVSDSTNVFRQADAGSEAQVRDSLMALVGQYRGRVAVSCFATNVARLDTLARVAEAHDRHISLAGRSLWRISEAARRTGYLKGVAPFLNDHDGAYLPKDKVLYVCTGSQGEPQAALSRIASGDHPHVVLGEGDVLIFSSRTIPGNERSVGRVHNQLVRRGVEVITERDHFVHVSGHPGRVEMERLYSWLKPKIAVPVHGEPRHLAEHARLAKSWGAEQVVIASNGAVVRLAEGRAEVVDHQPAGMLALDGTRLISADSPILRHRHRMIYNGTAVASVVVDPAGKLLAPPQLTLQGLLDPAADADLWREVEGAVAEAVGALEPRHGISDDALREAVRVAVRRSMRQILGKKPITEVHLMRLAHSL